MGKLKWYIIIDVPWHMLATEGIKLRSYSILLMLCISFTVSADSDLLELLQEDRDKDAKALGVILKFKKWPSKDEEKHIRKKLKSYGLVGGKRNETFKMWVFHWSENAPKNISKTKIKDLVLKPQTEAKQICLEVEALPVKSLEYCEPNFLSEPEQKVSDNGEPPPCGGVPASDSTLSSLLKWALESIFGKCPALFATKFGVLTAYKSKYWAQEMIGSDLLREELVAVKPPDSLSLAVFDSPERNHDVAVKNLITDDGPHAVLPELGQGKVSQMKTVFSSEYADAAEELKNNKPAFINNSMRWSCCGAKAILESVQSLIPPSVFVIGSGNFFPWPVGSSKRLASQKNDAILVGSLSPRGIVSAFSSAGDEVHILAPSDISIASAKKYGSYRRFSGTSGAAPLVTGSLAAFHWLSGYHPTGSEAKMLLEETAIPTIHSRERPRLNGVGMLNTYKLGMVGKRIGKKCAGKEESCFRREINNQENYIFKPEIPREELLLSASKFFPACGNNKKGESKIKRVSVDCDKRQEMLKKLRRAALLNPDQGDLWGFIACIYEEEGLSISAEGLRRIALANSSDFDNNEIIKDLKSIPYDKLYRLYTLFRYKKLWDSRLARLRYRLGDETALKELKKVAKEGGYHAKFSVVYSTVNMEDSYSIPLLKILARDENKKISKSAQHLLKRKGVSIND